MGMAAAAKVADMTGVAAMEMGAEAREGKATVAVVAEVVAPVD